MVMKIAVVEKTLSARDPYREYFPFEYERLALTTNKSTKILKKDISLPNNFADEYDYVILIGKEPSKFIAKVSNVTKMCGTLIEDKFIPILNPLSVKFNPGLEDTINMGLKKLRGHIDGTYVENLGKYHGIEDRQTALDYLSQVNNRSTKYVVVDIETSALHPREGYILGLAMTDRVGEGYYISSNCIDETIEELLQTIFNKKTVIFHNSKFDMKWLQYHFHFKFPDWEDTMLQHYLLNENEAHDLKTLAMKYTSMGDYDKELDDYKRNYCKQNKIRLSDFSYEFIPFEIMREYAGADADATLRLYKKFNPIIKAHFASLYEDIIQEGTEFLLEMEEIGIPFSKKALQEANVEFSNRIIELKTRLREFPEVLQTEKDLDVEFNPNSTAHLRHLFFKLLKLKSKKKTPTGALSTDKEVLEALSKQHPIPKIISEIRGIVKMHSTYVIKIIEGLDRDNRIRTGFHLHTVTSGRLSSSGKLNAQQFPRDDKTVKKCIRPADDDYVIFSQDLTTAEMYYAAALSGDEELCNVFRTGEDFHSMIAKIAFGSPYPASEIKEKQPKLRNASKAIAFGILYGAGPAKVASAAGISVEEARDIIKQYFDRFSRIKEWIEETKSTIKLNGCIYSAFGRKRRVPEVFSVSQEDQGHAVRSAMNFIVQSVASDINLLGAVDAHKEIKRRGLRANIFALVHDSIIGEVHKDDLDEIKTLLRDSIQKDRGIGIPGCPIGVDFEYGPSYGEVA